jgi:hypothetical protein
VAAVCCLGRVGAAGRLDGRARRAVRTVTGGCGDSLARCSGENTLPRPAALILARASGERTLPRRALLRFSAVLRGRWTLVPPLL